MFIFFFLFSLVFASTVQEENRSKRQFPFPFPPPPGSVANMIQERLRKRMHLLGNNQGSFIGQQGGFGSNLRNRIHNDVSTLRNITQAAKGCFTNEHGYKCCSQQLFAFMGGAFKNPLMERLLARIDLQKVVEKIIELVQKHFDTSFEVVMAHTGDFASKNTFRGDLMCKTKTPNGKTVLIYATPVPYSPEPGIIRRLTQKEIQSKHWGGNLLQISELSFLAKRAHRWIQ